MAYVIKKDEKYFTGKADSWSPNLKDSKKFSSQAKATSYTYYNDELKKLKGFRIMKENFFMKTLEALDECKCSGDNKKCKCKKGEKCDGKCTCGKNPIKEKMSDEEHAKKVAELPKWCTKCGKPMLGRTCPNDNCPTNKKAPIKEKRMSDDEGDFRYHDKKDREAEKMKKCPNCKELCKGNKCPSCGAEIMESKFEKYLIEAEKIDEGVEASVRPFYDSYVSNMQAKGLKALDFSAWYNDMKSKTLKGGFENGDVVAYLKSTTKAPSTFSRGR